MPPSSDNPSKRALERAHALAEGLFPHQIEGVAFLLTRERSILADDMGLGKTRQSIVALREARPDGPYLVVCPASVKENWSREIRLVLGTSAECVVIGSKSSWPDESFDGFLVINYDLLHRRSVELALYPFAGYVFDEAHYLKNYRSQRSRAARSLLEDAYEEAIVHCLTGTPLTNRPRDLFVLLQLVGHPLGRSFLGFAKRYCAAERGDYGWVTDGASNIEELTVQLHGTMLRRRKEDVLDLPPKLRTWLTVESAKPAGQREMRDLIEAFRAAGGVRKAAAELEESRISLLAKLSPIRKQIAIGKVKSTVEFVQGVLDQGEKVIVYTCFTIPAKRIAAHFGEAAILLTGKTPMSKRQGVVDAFQNDASIRVLVANMRAGGVGINLTAARTVCFNDLDWVPATHWQAEDRAYRIGQKHPVNVYYFAAANTLDEFVSHVLETKSQLVTSIVEGDSLAVDGAATADVLTELHDLVQELAPSLSGEDPDEVDSFLREAAEHFRRRAVPQLSAAAAPERSSISEEAIHALASAMQRPEPIRYRTVGSDGRAHVLEVDGVDVVCSCRGFAYRGQCKHARVLKHSLVAESPIPAEFERYVGP